MAEYHMAQGSAGRAALDDLTFDDQKFFIDSEINPYDGNAAKTSGAFATTIDAVLFFWDKEIEVSNFIANGNYTGETKTVPVGNCAMKNGIFNGSLQGLTILKRMRGANTFNAQMPDELGDDNEVIKFAAGSIPTTGGLHNMGDAKVVIIDGADPSKLNVNLGSAIENLVASKSVIDAAVSGGYWTQLVNGRRIISGRVVAARWDPLYNPTGVALPYGSDASNTAIGAVHPQATMEDFAAMANGAYSGSLPTSSTYDNSSKQIDDGWAIGSLYYSAEPFGSLVWMNANEITYAPESDRNRNSLALVDRE